MRTPRFSPSFFKGNRERLLELLPKDSIALVHSGTEYLRGGDALHPFRQDSSFFYFTGIETPGCSLLLIPNNGGKPEEILFIPPVDPEKEKWEGKMLSTKMAAEISGVKVVQSVDELKVVLFRSQKWKEKLYCELNEQFPESAVSPLHQLYHDIRLRLPGLQIKKLAPLTAQLRVRKQPMEINNIQKSLNIIDEALRRVMKTVKPGVMEYQVEADILHTYLTRGCKRVGFDTIAAGGGNATVLHYVTNDDSLNDGELILIDTGGEYGMYSGDITRTIPVNGSFSNRQKHCYQAVLEVQKKVIAAIQPGMKFSELVKISDQILGETYLAYGFISKPEEHGRVSLHGIGHYLGLDIHDVGHPDWTLDNGVIITVEPGLYLKEEGIGIRIEDNVLIKDGIVEILSSQIPKEINEIEAFMKRS